MTSSIELELAQIKGQLQTLTAVLDKAYEAFALASVFRDRLDALEKRLDLLAYSAPMPAMLQETAVGGLADPPDPFLSSAPSETPGESQSASPAASKVVPLDPFSTRRGKFYQGIVKEKA